jgi:tetratricopeptide (TPR) repeat protein
MERFRARSVNIVLPPAAAMLGLTYALAGRHADALTVLEEAVAHAHWSWIHSQPLACLAEGHLLAGRLDAVHEPAMRALDLARARGERGVEAWTLRLLGELAAASEAGPSAAEAHFREALALAGTLEMRPLIAHCHLGLGKLYRRTGKREEAREHFTTATTMYREMDMRFWLEKAEAEMKEPEG